MKKYALFVFGLILAVVLVNFSSAWWCATTVVNAPKVNLTIQGFGTWGDNGNTAGNVTGWLSYWNGTVPQGCTSDINYKYRDGDILCQNQCVGNDWREFYCTDYKGHPYETVIQWHDYIGSCSPSVPEFNSTGLIIASLAGIGAFFVIRRK